MKKFMYCLLAGVFILCTGCREAVIQSSNESRESTVNSAEEIKETEADLSVQPGEKVAEHLFTYTELSLPETVAQAENIYCCYYSEDCVLWAVGARNSNGTGDGPLYYTEQFVLWDYSSDAQYFKVETDSDIRSAFPYSDGILYGEYHSLEDGILWDLCYTDGETVEILDSGTGRIWDDDPCLFPVDGLPYYFWVNGTDYKDTVYGVSRIVDGEVEEVFQSHAELPWVVGAKCNGRHYCFDISDEDENFATIVVGDADGILFEYQLEEKLCDYCVTDQYMVCVVCNEETRKGTVITVDLNTEKAESFEEPYGPLWQLSGGIGNQLLCVDNDWSPRYIDVETKSVVRVKHPLSGLSNKPVRFYPVDENHFLSFVDPDSNLYQLFLLTIE